MAALRAQRTGYIRRPRVAGGRACVDPVSSSSNSDLPTLLRGSRGSQTRAQMSAVARRPIPFSTQVAHVNSFLAVLVLTFCQQVPKMTPKSPKRAQLVSKIAQNTPQEPPSRPPKTPKCGQNAVVLFDFTLRPFF